jgi:hypothetical protein
MDLRENETLELKKSTAELDRKFLPVPFPNLP